MTEKMSKNRVEEMPEAETKNDRRKPNPKYFERTKKEILSRNGACFGISCGDCPLAGEWKEGSGFICRGGGQGEYREIVEELNKITTKEPHS